MSIDAAIASLRVLAKDRFRVRDRTLQSLLSDLTGQFTKHGAFGSSRHALEVVRIYVEELLQSREALVSCMGEVLVSHIEVARDGRLRDLTVEVEAIFGARVGELKAKLQGAPGARRYAESGDMFGPFSTEAAHSAEALRTKLDLVAREYEARTKFPQEVSTIINIVGNTNSNNTIQAGFVGKDVSATIGSSSRELVDALGELLAVVQSAKISADQKGELQGAISTAMSEAAKPAPNKMTMRGILSGLRDFVSTGNEASELWGRIRQAAIALGISGL